MEFEFNTPRLVVSAPSGSSGKTTVTLGLLSAFKKRGLKVASLKKGPDYIDPKWHALATGGPSSNIDKFTMGNRWKELLAYSKSHDLLIIEGNHGLHDSIDLDGEGSTAAIARETGSPVLFVVDPKRMSRSIVPLIQGYMQFDPEVPFAGIILNNVAGERHANRLKSFIDHYLKIPLFGSVHRNENLRIPERHLGLTTAEETPENTEIIRHLGDTLEKQVDLDQLYKAACRVDPVIIDMPIIQVSQNNATERPTIAIAKDKAFGFYYPETFDALTAQGAQLIYFSPLTDTELPDADGYFFGGGFPELFSDQLEQNLSMRNSVKKTADAGKVIYAECGGLIYLANKLFPLEPESGKTTGNEGFSMAGVFSFDINMTKKPAGRGYVILSSSGTLDNKNTLWQIPGFTDLHAHEFHYSFPEIKANSPIPDLIYTVVKGTGFSSRLDGLLYKNTLASYTHLHPFSASWWAESFCNAALKQKKR